MKKRVWAEISIDSLIHNFNVVKQKAAGSKICCVIKDNAYGHGAVKLAKLYEELKADYFAVSNIDEALELRENSIKTPILILGYTPVEFAEVIKDNSITQCVYSLDYAKQLNQMGVQVRCHLKVDTGMNRIGFKNIDEMEEACKLKKLCFEGIFTHFAHSEDVESTQESFKLFNDTVIELGARNIKFLIRHCANSGSIFRYPEYCLDMVRPGIVLYGLGNYDELEQAITLKSIVSNIKMVKKGETIGYNKTYKVTKDIRVATIPIGYGDGYFRSNSGKNKVIINGKEASILGNICMDQMMVDISDIECELYDEVLIYGDLEKIASNIDTISYELICSINKRVPIIYK